MTDILPGTEENLERVRAVWMVLTAATIITRRTMLLQQSYNRIYDKGVIALLEISVNQFALGTGFAPVIRLHELIVICIDLSYHGFTDAEILIKFNSHKKSDCNL